MHQEDEDRHPELELPGIEEFLNGTKDKQWLLSMQQANKQIHGVV